MRAGSGAVTKLATGGPLAKLAERHIRGCCTSWDWGERLATQPAGGKMRRIAYDNVHIQRNIRDRMSWSPPSTCR